MSRRANYHYRVMEAFFSTVKREEAECFSSYGDARMPLFDYIEVFYNQRRRHSTLGRISPAAFERRTRRLSVDWRALGSCCESRTVLDGYATERLSTFFDRSRRLSEPTQ